MNYLQLGRNMVKYAHRIETKKITYVYNSKGINDFKQMNPNVAEELTNSFRGVSKPVLEIAVKKSKYPIGEIVLKDGIQEFSRDTFILKEGENVEEFLPKTNECLVKMQFGKSEIAKFAEKFEFLTKMVEDLISSLQNPSLEYWLKDRNKYRMGNIVLRDNDKVVLKGFFSKTKGENPLEKFHYTSINELVSGSAMKSDKVKKVYERLPQKFINRLWMFDDRTKSIIKRRFGIDCSPKKPNDIAKEWDITPSRVREIIRDCLEEMENADTYNRKLDTDLDNLGHLLNDSERYRIYRNNSILDMHNADYKMKRYKLRLQKFIR